MITEETNATKRGNNLVSKTEQAKNTFGEICSQKLTNCLLALRRDNRKGALEKRDWCGPAHSELSDVINIARSKAANQFCNQKWNCLIIGQIDPCKLQF